MHMRREINEIPEAVARLSTPASRDVLAETAAGLRALNPPAIITVARGSSDHAATYLKYAIELTLGIPVASIGPSTATIHKAPFRTEGLAAIAISQSGASGDLTALVTALRNSGTNTIAMTNSPESALADAASRVVDIGAGPEKAVAATKSFVNSIVAGLWVIALWSEDTALLEALEDLPEMLRRRQTRALQEGAFDVLRSAEHAVVIGRGAGLGVAGEVALKLIEVCRIHASAYSGAEVLHGPRAILTEGFPVVALQGGAVGGLDQSLEELTLQGAAIVPLGAADLIGHPLVAPILDITLIYDFLERLSRARGFSADTPEHLSKETYTL